MMRLRQIERAILPVILAAICIAAPGVLHAAAAGRTKHEPAHKARRHVVVHHSVHHVRRRATRSRYHRSHYRRSRYHRSRYHRSRYRRYRYHRYRHPVRPSSDRIDQIQQALARAGFYQGDPSGAWDAQTVEAMKGFQQAHGIAPTGKIDATTLQQLGLGSDVAGLAPPRPLIAANAAGSSE